LLVSKVANHTSELPINTLSPIPPLNIHTRCADLPTYLRQIAPRR
ncbi:hypothetical protein CGCVW01_v007491, partial [Colletotrichum viniferum]